MANNIKLSTAVRNGMLDAITTAVGTSARWKIYDGAQPAGPGTAVGAQVVLADLTCNATAFAAAAASGVLTANAITQDSSADATGTAAWFRILKSDNTTACIDGTVGTSGADLNLNSTSITSTAIVQITAATFTAGNA